MIRFAAIPALVTLSLSALPAEADVTPEQVWDHWQRAAAAYGGALTAGAVTREGDTLVISDMRSANAAAADATPLAWLRLRQLDDGTVRMTAVPEQEIAVTFQGPEGEKVETTYTLASEALEGIISGDPDRLDHAISADLLRVTYPLPPDADFRDAEVEIALNGAAFTYVSDLGGPAAASLSGEGGARSASFALSGVDDEGTALVISGAQSPLRASYAATLPEGADMASAFAADTSLTVTTERGTLDMTATDTDDAALALQGGTGPARLSAVTADGQLEYSWSVADLSSEINVSGLAEPFTLRMAEYSSSFVMPIATSDTPGPFRFALSLESLEMSDSIWDRIDPVGAFARGPMTLAIDLGGTMRWTVDVFSNPQVAQTLDGAPFEVDALRLDRLDVAGVGLAVSGTGDFAIDADALAAGSAGTGLPLNGTLKLTARGIDQFFQALIKAGVAPAQQLTGLRGMIGMFTVPVEGEADTVRSEIEITPQGKILANGVPFN